MKFPISNGMKIESPAFINNGEIPSKFTCDGKGINPELIFKDIPKKAKSLVLTVDDPDIPQFVKEKNNIDIWDHWLLWNISPKTMEIKENSVPTEAMVGLNTSGENKYQGPCPPDREHRYFFKLYALDTILSLNSNTSAVELKNTMEEYILEKSELIGKYKRN